ncbi:putative gibberellin 3-beta hydroxylase [Xylogone sp. PMI_703]|nr:putative gibberellin 3-beta hydroxylase [Xylogone sp. PMI_703]
MSATMTESAKPHTITLQNGTVVNVKSNIPTRAETLPIIDVSRMYSPNLEDRKAVAEEVRKAAHDIGFFYVVNHGVDPKYTDATFEAAKNFFTLPKETKMKVHTDLVPNEYVGYHPLEAYARNSKKLKDLSEAFNWAYDAKYDPEAVDPNEKSINIWPDEADAPGFKETLFAHHTQMLTFARKMARIFALALHLEEDAFDKYIKRPEAGMRILHYPNQQASPDDQDGIGAHTDFECFTIVTQDNSGGLQVLSKEGEWIQAKPVPGAFVVNIADCFMRQTNDFFVSTVHRVINKSGAERYSVPFFFGFDRSKVLEAIPTCVSEGNPMKYPIMTAGEYYAFRANKAKKGKY